MRIFVQLTENEGELLENYSKFHNITQEEALKQAFFEKLEDEFDAKIGDQAYDDYLNTGKKSRPAREFWDELDD